MTKMRIPVYMSKYNLLEEKMTKEDWDHYLKCREINDVEYSEEELKALYDEAVRLVCEEGNKKSTEFCIKHKFPLVPSLAKSYKDIYGFKYIQDYNLSLAKKEYPYDF